MFRIGEVGVRQTTDQISGNMRLATAMGTVDPQKRATSLVTHNVDRTQSSMGVNLSPIARGDVSDPNRTPLRREQFRSLPTGFERNHPFVTN